MTNRRTTAAPRKRMKPTSASSNVLRAQSGRAANVGGVEPESTVSATGARIATDDPRHAVLEELEAALREQPGLDAEGLDFALKHFKEAVFSAPLDPQVDVQNATAWTDMLNTLVDGGLLQEGDRNDLTRDFEAAMHSLAEPDVALAIEFAKRLESDGEAEAIAWLQQRRDADDVAACEQQSSTTDVVAKDQITRSRSRRVRGPPK